MRLLHHFGKSIYYSFWLYNRLFKYRFQVPLHLFSLAIAAYYKGLIKMLIYMYT